MSGKRSPRAERVKKSAVIRRRRRDIVKSAGRSLEVMELFRDSQQPLRLVDIAAQLSLPQSSASMLLRSLVSMGYLIPSRNSRSFLPSMRLTLLGNWLNAKVFVRGDLKRLTEEISHLTGDTVILATRNDTYVEVLSIVQGRMDNLFHTRPGDARALTRALLGHMILSTLQRSEVEGLVSRINAEQKDASRRVSYKTLVPILDRIRQHGYGYEEGSTIPGGAGVAVLLPRMMENEVLVVSNVGTIDRIRPRKDEILGLVQATIASYFGHANSA